MEQAHPVTLAGVQLYVRPTRGKGVFYKGVFYKGLFCITLCNTGKVFAARAGR